MMGTVHLLWNKVRSKTQSFHQLEHDPLAAVHLCAKLFILEKVRISHCQVDCELLVHRISVGVFKGLENFADDIKI
jgi:hypothetical protein